MGTSDEQVAKTDEGAQIVTDKLTDAPTPRVDNEDHWFVDRDESGLLGVDTVRADFARDLERELTAMRDVLLRNGFVECDIAACNCGSWHARYGLPERMAEIKDALAEAGHPLCNENGNLTRNALAELIADRNACRAALRELVECEDALSKGSIPGKCSAATLFHSNRARKKKAITAARKLTGDGND